MDSRDKYRQKVRTGATEATWTFWKILPPLIFIVVVAIAIFVVLGWLLTGSEIITKNIEREVIQQSQQYTESKQALLQNLYTEYLSLQTKVAQANAAGVTEVVEAAKAQQLAILAQMRRETTNISSSEIPVEVRNLLNR